MSILPPSSSSSDLTTESSMSSSPVLRRHMQRSNSLSPLPRGTESRIEGRKRLLVTENTARNTKEIYDVAMKAKPESFVQIPMENFIERCITIPVIPFKTWRREVTAALLSEARKTDFSKQALQNVVNDTFHRCLDFSSILERIAMASSLLNNSSLDKFSDSHPLFFWKKFKSLEAKFQSQYDLLYQVMGKQEAYAILAYATQKEGEIIKKSFCAEIDAIADFEKRKQALLNCSVKFSSLNDSHLCSIPPFAQNYKEFSESFRSFLTNGPFSEESIRFNNECLVIPDYKNLGLEESEAEEVFLKWLILHFQRKMQIESAPSPKMQIESFAMAPTLSSKFEKHLTSQVEKNLKKEFAKDISVKEMSPEELEKRLQAFFERFQKDTLDFSTQLRPFSLFLSNYLLRHPKFQVKEWDQVSEILISFYKRLYQLKEKHKFIPSLSLLQSLGFVSYALCGQFLNRIGKSDKYVPMADTYQLKLNRKKIGCYDIHFKDKCFDTTHIKWFDVMYNEAVKGTIKVHWNVSGKISSDDYSFQLSMHDPVFSSNCNEEEELVIMDQLLCALQNVDQVGFKGAKVMYKSKAVAIDSKMARLFDDSSPRK